ncbi:MAG: polysaccharide pyruvyl transferase CsaB [bacterium]|nr:polysaccharide pyruvyl transferase CsaB [bacterium]MDD5354879.1 polysaccharide pyruvyl transferase CsaB [bacterium]MDD5756021.1 polysaccharide pyruvyl transferase CsaB [bacterium]
MSKVLISGYYGYDNLGDELILKAIIEHLRSLDPALDITVISSNPWRTVNLHPAIEAVSRKNVFGIFKALRQCRLFISGGGGLLQDTTGQGSVLYYLGWGIIAKKIFRKKVMLYAQGIGPLHKGLSRFLVNAWIGKMDLITLREDKSLQLLRELRVPETMIKITADPVLGITLKNCNPVAKHPLCIGVVLRQDQDKLRSVPRWCEILNSVKNTYNARILLLPFQDPNDVNLSRAIKESMKGKVDLKNWDTLEDIFTFYENVDILISMRLHALILAAVYGKPMLGINYDPKIDSFLRLFGQQAVTSDKIVQKLEDLVVRQKNIATEQNAVLLKLQEYARENARLAMNLIKEQGQ